MGRLCRKPECIAVRAGLAENAEVFQAQRLLLTEATKLWQDATGKHNADPPLRVLLGWLVEERGRLQRLIEDE